MHVLFVLVVTDKIDDERTEKKNRLFHRRIYGAFYSSSGAKANTL